MMWARHRAGFTLIELIVSVAILAIGLGVVAGGLVSAGSDRVAPDPWSEQLDQGRRGAIMTGAPTVVWPDSAHVQPPVLFLPDGRSVGRDAFAPHDSVSPR